MRILAAVEPISIDQLGLTAHNEEPLEKTVGKLCGIFYVCGPTGSGKTTTLHSILKFLIAPNTKIWTDEETVEIAQKGLRQVEITKKPALTLRFSHTTFCGRTRTSSWLASCASKKRCRWVWRHLLMAIWFFSTLHTNSPPESVMRLLDMGMHSFNFADALLGILN